MVIDSYKVRELSRTISDQAGRAAANLARDRARANLLRARRYRTGALLLSIEVTEFRRRKGGAGFRVGSTLPYAYWQEEGIGPVYPVKAKVLRFRPKGSNTFIFRPRTKGFKGAHYLRNAFKSIKVQDFRPNGKLSGLTRR